MAQLSDERLAALYEIWRPLGGEMLHLVTDLIDHRTAVRVLLKSARWRCIFGTG